MAGVTPAQLHTTGAWLPGTVTAARPAGGDRDQASRGAGVQSGPTEQEQREIRELARRDREVRAHEQAHASVGGAHAGAPRFEYERGPNGVRYAVSGSVQIDTSEVPGDPQATLTKMQIVQRAALAPAEPSPQDRAVAAEAARKAAEARRELAEQRAEEGAAAGPGAGFLAGPGETGSAFEQVLGNFVDTRA